MDCICNQDNLPMLPVSVTLQFCYNGIPLFSGQKKKHYLNSKVNPCGKMDCVSQVPLLELSNLFLMFLNRFPYFACIVHPL